ncbi:type IV toxin-antitoxin system AbiEi family antitoxin domain-containing protein [Haloechinothrix salitolerans]|uniref:Type IV toxin-antitoxin system AbiEi family antitoxin domain-containing protein n=1 Tax=Haloechinothrix salitolerans TaxID=926830 RepID=A0ABW2BU81_9PSEU
MSETMPTLYELAEGQAGYFSAAQAVAAGVSRRTLSGRVRSGDLERVRYGIYRLRRFPGHRNEDVVAACLWAGSDSAASHETALVVHGISDAMPANIHVTVPRPFRGRQRGVVVHHAPLEAMDREVHDSVPVTTLSRTLADVAVTSEPTVVRQAVAEAMERGALTRRQIRKLARERPALAPAIVDVLAGE